MRPRISIGCQQYKTVKRVTGVPERGFTGRKRIKGKEMVAKNFPNFINATYIQLLADQ